MKFFYTHQDLGSVGLKRSRNADSDTETTANKKARTSDMHNEGADAPVGELLADAKPSNTETPTALNSTGMTYHVGEFNLQEEDLQWTEADKTQLEADDEMGFREVQKFNDVMVLVAV